MSKIKKDLCDWILENELVEKWVEEDIVNIDGLGDCYLFDNETIFNDDYHLDLQETDLEELEEIGCSNIVYKFGDNWYYSSVKCEIAEMNILQNVGNAWVDIDEPFTHLGVHGRLELLNGSSDYDEWANRARFLGHKSLGICEKNTLAGTLLFQNACLKYGINSILGITIDVSYNESVNEVKIYSTNQTGWVNLMNISAFINSSECKNSVVDFDKLLNYLDGNILVFGKSWIPTKDILDKIDNRCDYYYQLDTTEYRSDTIDLFYLNKIKEYVDTYGFRSKILKPILLSDSYYVNQNEHDVKKTLNFIDGGVKEHNSNEQYLRSFSFHYDKMESMFESIDQYEDLIYSATNSTMEVAIKCDFTIETRFLNMPEYELTKEEKQKYGDKYGLFDHIVDSNWEDLVPKGKDDEFEDRLDEEFRVIDDNGFLDYFLINWDWLKYCKENNIYTGVARGSAGGSALSYLLGVTNIDPIEYDLLFERFLNEGRLKKTVKTHYSVINIGDSKSLKFKNNKLVSVLRDEVNEYVFAKDLQIGDILSDGNKVLDCFEETEETLTAGSPPDIDSDVESRKRQDVKEYLEKRYGKDRVVSIGTFTKLGIKSAISDVCRAMGVNVKLYRFITKMITNKEADMSFKEFFVKAQTNKTIKKFINDYPEVIEMVGKVMGNSKSPSVHAAGVVITPKYHNGKRMSACDWIPVKEHDGMIVSEWEGGLLESAGMLKLDLLATKVLDKIHDVVDKVKETEGVDIDYREIYTKKVADKKVYSVFQKGYTQDIFQFSSEGMTKFVESMKPTHIGDLIAANALYRPATMNLGFHEDYVEMKHGRREVEYDWGMEDVTKDTFGTMCYQEQMMKAVQKIGGFSLQEADAVRKAMGKKIQSVMDSYKDRFVDGAVKNGCDEFEAIKIWNKIEQGASYGFNKSHSAAYALTAYITAWLKHYYPLQFYTMSLDWADDDKKLEIISEIASDNRFDIVPPCVNKSGFDFITDYDEKKIYWSLKSIKQVGDVAVRTIIEERESNGNFKSFTDFVERMIGKKVNKTVIKNLILSGSFDEVVGIQNVLGRMKILEHYYENILEEDLCTEEFPRSQVGKDFFWSSIQSNLSGLGNINYKKAFTTCNIKKERNRVPFLDSNKINEDSRIDKAYFFGATISEVSEITTAKGGTFGKVILQANNEIFSLILWSQEWVKYGEELKKSKGRVVIFNAKISFDSYTSKNGLYGYKQTLIEVI